MSSQYGLVSYSMFRNIIPFFYKQKKKKKKKPVKFRYLELFGEKFNFGLYFYK